MTGNDSWEQARQFGEIIGYDSSIITKFDVDQKGGSCLSVSYVSKKPIIFVGVGQNYHDLIAFSIEKYVDDLLSRL
jgi:fused signal recognition particle receptor